MYKPKEIKKYLCLSALICGLIILSFSSARAQDLPKEIRGYKVQRAKVIVKTRADETVAKDNSEVFIRMGEPKLIDVSLTRITFEISAETISSSQSGTVDFLQFYDFRVNGLTVNVEEYEESFEFRKNRTAVLPKPVKISISAGQALRGALEEMKESKAEWTVTGRVFVFGQFKKSFLKFKRVVPVEINLKIKNPTK